MQTKISFSLFMIALVLVEGEEIILGGDIVLRINEVSVEEGGNYDEIYGSIARLKPGDNLVIIIFRQGQPLKLSIPVTETKSRFNPSKE